MNYSLSVVIPVYNSALYLKACLDSLLNAKGIDAVEIILIDDGSTDGSSLIIDNCSSLHSNVLAMHKDNGGPSEARNAGLQMASGRYVFFCDSDDMVVSELLSDIIAVTQIDNSDIILWDSELIDRDGNKITDVKKYKYSHEGLGGSKSFYTGKDIIRKQLDNRGDFAATVWMGAFLKSYLVENGLFFKEGIIHEDELWVPQVLLNAKKVHYLPYKMYLYREHEGSITRPAVKDWTKHIESIQLIYPELYKYYDTKLDNDPLKERLMENLTRRYLYKIFKYDYCGNGFARRVDHRLLWRTSVRFKDKIKVIILWISGILK